MNDLSKKEETKIEKTGVSKKKASGSNELLHKKLENFLLLYYQAYLKGETAIESEIRAAFLSLVKKDEDFALKVRMLQLDYLYLENVDMEGAWDEATEELFPEVEVVDKPLDEARENTLIVYKKKVFELLRSIR